MKKSIIPIFIMSLGLLGCHSTQQQCAKKFDMGKSPEIPSSFETDKDAIMSKAYWELWNADVQKGIDARIEKFRKADASLKIDDADTSKPVEVKQVSHNFIFGAHIFNFNQLGKTQYNDIYKSLYAKDSLFNSATIAFYWRTFEFEEGKPRFETQNWDTEEFWNTIPHPKLQPHWRRPSTDQVVEFCKAKGIRMHGHPLIWGNRRWHLPEAWLFNNYANAEQKAFWKKHYRRLNPEGELTPYAREKEYQKMSMQDLEKLFGSLAKKQAELSEIRVKEIAKRYGDVIQSWDVVNESATDFSYGKLPSGDVLTKSGYGVMEANYDLNAFQLAQKYLPKKALLNINDYNMKKSFYLDQIQSLKKRGAKIDIVGSQMHLFEPKQTLDISKGAKIQTPEQVAEVMARLSKADRPIHLSEITITAAGTSDRERMIQAIVLRNLYRMWFSIENMMGITWWNVVDDCGAPGEPSYSGIFTRDMKPKPAYFAMNNLINKEWKTNLSTKVDKDGNVKFRGFKGDYEIVYTDKNGAKKTIKYNLK